MKKYYRYTFFPLSNSDNDNNTTVIEEVSEKHQRYMGLKIEIQKMFVQSL